ncbi:MAG: hypothetical protein ACRDH2_08660 [Anaerolineales bacterium]
MQGAKLKRLAGLALVAALLGVWPRPSAALDHSLPLFAEVALRPGLIRIPTATRTRAGLFARSWPTIVRADALAFSISQTLA